MFGFRLKAFRLSSRRSLNQHGSHELTNILKYSTLPGRTLSIVNALNKLTWIRHCERQRSNLCFEIAEPVPNEARNLTNSLLRLCLATVLLAMTTFF